MKRLLTIGPKYEKAEEVRKFIDTLPPAFDQCGKMLWEGRNKIKSFLLTDGTELVVKRFKELKFFQQFGYLFRQHKAAKSFVNGQELLRRGIDTPYPVAYIELHDPYFISDAFYICERNDMPPIEDLLCRDDWDRDLALAFAAFVARLHQAGILHHDLNDTNVRFNKTADGYQFSLIDINRMDFFDNIDAIPMKERIENMTRFTGRLPLFEFVAREYARICGLDIDQWVSLAVAQKQRHDRNWYLRKRLLHPFRHY